MKKYMYTSKLYFFTVILSTLFLFTLGTHYFLVFNENIFFESYLALSFISLYAILSFIDTRIGGLFYVMNLIMTYIILFNYNFLLSGISLMVFGTPAYIFSIFHTESERRFFFVFEKIKTTSRKRYLYATISILILVFFVSSSFIKNDLNGILYDITIAILMIVTGIFTLTNNSKKWLFRVMYSIMVLLIFNIYEIDLIFIYMEILRIIYCFSSFIFVVNDMENINKLNK